MNLASVVHYLEDDAPRHLAEEWDNVGLLVEPTAPHIVHNILLTNDLTHRVCREAVEKKVNLILSYHPPIFTGLKRLTQKSIKERIVIECIENRIALYSPHTIYDNSKDGVNHWLLNAFKLYQKPDSVTTLHQKFASKTPDGAEHRLDLKLNAKADILLGEIDKILQTSSNNNIDIMNYKDDNNEDKMLVTIRLNEPELVAITDLLEQYPAVLDESSLMKLEKLPLPGYGAGLRCETEGLSLKTAVVCVKKLLGLEHLRLALGEGKELDSLVGSVAVCAGSGRTVLTGAKGDLYLTGEMSHHDVLACTELGISVILTEHSNSERGFLTVLKKRLEAQFENTGVGFITSEEDHDPLKVV